MKILTISDFENHDCKASEEHGCSTCEQWELMTEQERDMGSNLPPLEEDLGVDNYKLEEDIY